MSPTWRADDSFLDMEKGQLKGVRRAKDALKKAGIRGGRRILTSRDEGMDSTRQDLQRARMPKGFVSWQLPITIGPDHNTVIFMTVGAPGAVVPEHAHKGDLFRLVIAGSIFYKDKELTAGDWMFVPADVPYGFTTGPLGAIICHPYSRGRTPDEAARPARRVRARRSASRSAPR